MKYPTNNYSVFRLSVKGKRADKNGRAEDPAVSYIAEIFYSPRMSFCVSRMSWFLKFTYSSVQST